VVGTVMLGLLLLMAMVPGWLAPYDPGETVGRPLQRPGGEFLLGTNDIGQDLLSELIWGTRISLVTGVAVGGIAVAIGLAVGLAAASSGGWPGRMALRLMDLTLVLPFFPLVLLLGAYLGGDQAAVILLLSAVLWAGPARVIRARALTVLEEPYVDAAVAAGGRRRHVLLRHVGPAVLDLAAVQFLFVASAAILAEAGLAFLGLGDPTQKSWGTMLHFAQASGAALGDAWLWWVLPAGLLITATVMSFVLVFYSIELRLDPRNTRSSG
jgi:ABC-type dipeptide/oligopeptide/nickel transport system permease subunit